MLRRLWRRLMAFAGWAQADADVGRRLKDKDAPDAITEAQARKVVLLEAKRRIAIRAAHLHKEMGMRPRDALAQARAEWDAKYGSGRR